MVYVRRVDGRIAGVFENPQPQPDGTDYAPEVLADDDPEVVAFLNPPPPEPQA